MILLKGVTVVHGFQGAGKTLFLTKYAFDMKNEYKYIYANYELKNIDYIPLDIIKLFIEKQEIKHSLILIDEGHLFFNNRSAMSSFNRLITWFFTQTRKRSNSVLITTIPQMLDINIRWRSAYFHAFPQPLAPNYYFDVIKYYNHFKECRKLKRLKNINQQLKQIELCKKALNKSHILTEDADILREINPAYVLSYNLPITHFKVEFYSNPPEKKPFHTIAFNGLKYYSLYNTEQLIMPDWEKLREWEKQQKKQKRKR